MSWSANAGLLYHFVKDVDLLPNLARAFRYHFRHSKNVSNTLTLEIFVRLGDPSLEPEKSYSADLGLRVWKSRFNLQADVFVNYGINNMIVEKPPRICLQAYVRFRRRNNSGPDQCQWEKSILYGLDMKFAYNFSTDFVLFGSGAYVRGMALETDGNFPLIPLPLNGRLAYGIPIPVWAL